MRFGQEKRRNGEDAAQRLIRAFARRIALLAVPLLFLGHGARAQAPTVSVWEQFDVTGAVTTLWSTGEGTAWIRGKGVPLPGRHFCVASNTEAPSFVFRCGFSHEPVFGETGLIPAQFGFILRFYDVQNYYAIHFTGENEIRFERTVGGKTEILARASGYAPSGLDNYLDAQCTDAQYRIRFNGRLIFDVIDDKVMAGRAGVFADQAAPFTTFDAAFYDNPAAPFLYVPLLMVKLPYVLWVGRDQAIVLWEMNRPVQAEVTYGELGQEEAGLITVPAGDTVQKTVLAGLKPNTRYVFRVRAEGRNRGGGEFQTDVGPGNAFTAAFVGNSNGNPEGFRLFSEMIRQHTPNMVIHLGGAVVQGSRPDEWNTFFFQPGENLLGRAPTYMAIGQSENTPSRSLFERYLPYPSLPAMFTREARKGYYEFLYGDAAFAILDNCVEIAPGTPQYAWLKHMLSSAPFQRAAWRIVCCHEPPWSVERGRWKAGNAQVRDHVLPLCVQNGVQLLVGGNAPAYKRGLVDGVVQIVNGGGCGYASDPASAAYGFGAQLLGYVTPQYSIMRIKGTHLDWSCFNEKNELLDQFTLESGAVRSVAAAQ